MDAALHLPSAAPKGRPGVASEDRRTLRRRPLLLQLEVREAATGRRVGRLVDLSAGGFLVVGSEPVAAHAPTWFEIPLPEPICGLERLEVEARSLWSRRDANPALYLTGLQIEGGSEEDLDAVVALTFRFRMA